MSGWRQLLSRTRLFFAAACVVCAAGCSNQDNAGLSFVFQRPEDMGFVCFAPLEPPRQGEYAVLPQRCCRVYDASGSVKAPGETPACSLVDGVPVGTPALHALVTQTTRGEVAAVDLVSRRVLDSNREIPGYTFLDTGGLPTAIVVPPELPGVVPTDSTRPVAAGPVWTYVASAEQMQIRAIPTCRFRNGGQCGPDLLNDGAPDQNGVLDQPFSATTYDARTQVQLPAAPQDLRLGPGPAGPNTALWVTMPELGLIARIELAQVPIVTVDQRPDGLPGTADYAAPVDAFAVVEAGTAQARPKEPAFFRVPSAPDAQAPLPIAEEEYRAICGLGYPYRRLPLTLPLAPRNPSTDDVSPTEMHFVSLTGSEDKPDLLFVADRVSPVLHAFSVGSDGGLTALGGLPTGATVRTFAVTPAVPALGPDLRLIPAPPAPPATKRYVYAADENGRMMVFDFVATPPVDGQIQKPLLQPLLAPAPGTRYADRIEVPSPITALEVISTLDQSDYVCGSAVNLTPLADRPTRQPATRAQLVEERAASLAALQQLPTTSVEERLKLQLEVAQLEGQIAIYDTAGGDYLRGVFVISAAASGVISVIDVYDLDVSCRARKECCETEDCRPIVNPAPPPAELPDSLDTARNPSTQTALAVRRHTVRRRLSGSLDTLASSQALLEPPTRIELPPPDPNAPPPDPNAPPPDPNAPPAPVVIEPVPLGGACGSAPDEPFVKASPASVCAPADPWTELSQTWAVDYQGLLPRSQTMGAALQFDDPSSDLFEVRLPVGYDACATGVLDDSVSPEGRMQDDLDGDLVAVVGAPAAGPRGAGCPTPSDAAPFVLRIVEAYNERLVVRVDPGYAMTTEFGTEAGVRAMLARCYPDLVDLELRAALYLVTSSSAIYLHRVISAVDGRCVVDPGQSPLLTSRLSVVSDEDPLTSAPEDERYAFKNPYVEFTLAGPVEMSTGVPEAREVSVQVLNGSAGLSLTSVNANDGVSDTLPATLRYVPEVGRLFVLDTASQGLRRYTLRPFENDGQAFR